MNRHSIFFTLALTFILSLLVISASFFLILDDAKKEHIKQVKYKYFSIAKMVNAQMLRSEDTDILAQEVQKAGLTLVVNAQEIEKLLYNENLKLRAQQLREHLLVAIFEDKKRRLVHVQTPRTEFILVDRSKDDPKTKVILGVFIFIVLVLILSAIATFRKLYTLKELQDHVKNFGNEEFDFEHDSNKKDEVTLLANEFSNSARKLKKIKEARNIFIRNIMHELKTPITKGKFLVELPCTNENQEKLKKVFYRMETLINELAQIEQLMSTTKAVQTKTYLLDDVIENAIDLLMLDEKFVEYEPNQYKLQGDFKLLSIAVKNLIDNGIKYSNNKKIEIKVYENEIHFISQGNKLEKTLEEYCEPFIKSDENNTQSFGLGLYIVQNILQAFGYGLQYEYLNGNNIFKMVKYPKS